MEVKRVLVTGGAGFIGSHLVDELVKKGYIVSIIDNLSTGRKENLNLKARFYNLDIRDSKISDVFEKEKPQIVFHLAAHISLRESIKDPINDAQINIIGSLNLIQSFINFIKKSNRSFSDFKFIFSSTGGAIYGNTEMIPTSEDYNPRPTSPYGIAKFAIEKYLYSYKEQYNLPYIALRYANVYGPRQDCYGEAGVVAIFCNKILNKEKVVIHNDGEQTRDFVFVKDIVNANLLALEGDKLGVFNVGSGQETTINTIFNKIGELIGLEFDKEYRKLELKEQLRACLDNKKAKEGLGWFPKYNLNEGLKKTVEYFKNDS